MALFTKSAPAHTAKALNYDAPRAFTAAAARMTVTDKKDIELFRQRLTSSAARWQSDAFLYYDQIGEIKFAYNLFANVASRARLFPAVGTGGGKPPASLEAMDDLTPRIADAARHAMSRLVSGTSPATLIRMMALGFSVPGECYLVQVPKRLGSGTPERWKIVSTQELQVTPDGLALKPTRDSRAQDFIELPPRTFVGRIWREHPTFSGEPDSSMLGVLDACSELLLLNRTFRATARSRLNAGAMYVPDGLSTANEIFPGPPDSPPDSPPEAAEEEDPFEQELIDSMTQPITDPDSASAVVPLLIRGPADLGEKIQLFKFERSFDPALATRSDRVLDRILQGLDVPKEVVSGVAQVRYANATAISDSLYQAHVEPMLLLICDSLTEVYLRPALEATGFTPEQARRIVVWYDPSAITTRPDRAADADAGYDRYVISADSWRSSHGFSDADRPSPDEIAYRMLVEKGQVPPEMTELLLQKFAPELMKAIRSEQVNSAQSGLPPEVQQALGTPPSQAASPV